MNPVTKERSADERAGRMNGMFVHPDVTADGKQRASVSLRRLRTLWFNTGTRCNLTCRNCYIESSPSNDALVYLRTAEVMGYLDEIRAMALPTEEIGFTGGEPFMNPELLPMLELVLQRGFQALVLTNAMRPMMKCADALEALSKRYADALAVRVSLDHFEAAKHEDERGLGSYRPTIEGLRWLSRTGVRVHLAGRTRWGEDEASLRAGFAELLAAEGIALDAYDPAQLVLFPEMDLRARVPEITTDCWGILNKSPDDMMCATSRMVVKHRGAAAPSVVSCTLLPYEAQFDYGPRLGDALQPVKLNHPHCAKFCVLGGGKCSG